MNTLSTSFPKQLTPRWVFFRIHAMSVVAGLTGIYPQTCSERVKILVLFPTNRQAQPFKTRFDMPPPDIA